MYVTIYTGELEDEILKQYGSGRNSVSVPLLTSVSFALKLIYYIREISSPDILKRRIQDNGPIRGHNS